VSKPAWLPSSGEVVREALIVIGGAALAAVVVGYFPEFKAWLRNKWQ
jgi:ABC-type cobalt transport system substrate-binding protein